MWEYEHAALNGAAEQESAIHHCAESGADESSLHLRVDSRLMRAATRTAMASRSWCNGVPDLTGPVLGDAGGGTGLRRTISLPGLRVANGKSAKKRTPGKRARGSANIRRRIANRYESGGGT